MQDNLLNLAKCAAVAAGAEIMKFYQNCRVSFKEDKSPITQADLAANEKIIEILSQSSLPICSEERIAATSDELFWLVDPLDGTREFIKQNGEFCVCIALISQARPILGVIFIPVSGELFYATKGGGVKREILGNASADVKFSPSNLARTRDKASKNLMFVSGETPVSTRLADALNLHQMRVGSAIKFCLLARGESGIYYRTHPSSIWDNAAGELIASEAGAAMIDLQTLKAPLYDTANLRCGKFIVIGEEFLERKVEILEWLAQSKR